jgi:hypothetical protein
MLAKSLVRHLLRPKVNPLIGGEHPAVVINLRLENDFNYRLEDGFLILLESLT